MKEKSLKTQWKNYSETENNRIVRLKMNSLGLRALYQFDVCNETVSWYALSSPSFKDLRYNMYFLI